MNEENKRKLREMVSEFFETLARARGFENYQEGIRAIREECKNNETSPAPWLHKVARETYPTEPDSVPVGQFYEILGVIETIEQLASKLDDLPDDQFPEIEKFLVHMNRKWLPQKRAEHAATAKALPQYRRGGPKKKMPSDDECRKICEEIANEYKRTGSAGEAQRIVARRRKLTVRMIQRIKARSRELFADQHRQPDIIDE